MIRIVWYGGGVELAARKAARQRTLIPVLIPPIGGGGGGPISIAQVTNLQAALDAIHTHLLALEGGAPPPPPPPSPSYPFNTALLTLFEDF